MPSAEWSASLLQAGRFSPRRDQSDIWLVLIDFPVVILPVHIERAGAKGELAMCYPSKELIFPFLAITALVATSLVCHGGTPAATPFIPSLTSTPTVHERFGQPSDYFPTTPGSEWVYKIEIGEMEPCSYQVLVLPRDDGQTKVQASRVRYESLGHTERKTFVLAIRVLGPATEQGPLKHPNGVALEIVEDELGIFEYAKQVFWTIGSPDDFIVNEVVIYQWDTPGMRFDLQDVNGFEDAFSPRVLLFDAEPGAQRAPSDSPKDVLTFIGFEDQVPQYEGNPCPCLHFLRNAEGVRSLDTRPPLCLSHGFTEDTWFAKGRGLVRLEQKVDGATSMVWTLVESK